MELHTWQATRLATHGRCMPLRQNTQSIACMGGNMGRGGMCQCSRGTEARNPAWGLGFRERMLGRAGTGASTGPLHGPTMPHKKLSTDHTAVARGTAGVVCVVSLGTLSSKETCLNWVVLSWDFWDDASSASSCSAACAARERCRACRTLQQTGGQAGGGGTRGDEFCARGVAGSECIAGGGGRRGLLAGAEGRG